MVDTRLRELERTIRANPGATDALLRLRIIVDQTGDAGARSMLDALTQVPGVTVNPWEGGEGLKSKPKVGTGVTYGAGSDSYPGTVVEVSKTGHSIKVRGDRTIRLSGNFKDGNWEGTYHVEVPLEDDSERLTTYTRRRNWKQCVHCGSRKRAAATTCLANGNCRDATKSYGSLWFPVYAQKGDTGRRISTLTIGSRRYYQDPHF